MKTIYRIRTGIVCGLRRELLRNNHILKAKLKLFDSLDANNSSAIFFFFFARYKILQVYRYGQGLRACQTAAGSIIRQASYEALKCVANIAWFYGSPQRNAFLIFTKRPAIGAKRYGLERNSVEQKW